MDIHILYIWASLNVHMASIYVHMGYINLYTWCMFVCDARAKHMWIL